MSGNASLKALSRHLPLLRAPLLVNNVIALTLSGICASNPVYIVELIFLSISFVAGSVDLIRYSHKQRAGTSSRLDQEDDNHHHDGSWFRAAVDGLLSMLLLPVWIIGLVASSWMVAVIATFGAFIAWSLHLTSSSVEFHVLLKLRRPAIRRCPNCDCDLSIAGWLADVTRSVGQNSPTPQPLPEPSGQDMEAASSANEYDQEETDRLILRDDERKS